MFKFICPKLLAKASLNLAGFGTDVSRKKPVARQGCVEPVLFTLLYKNPKKYGYER